MPPLLVPLQRMWARNVYSSASCTTRRPNSCPAITAHYRHGSTLTHNAETPSLLYAFRPGLRLPRPFRRRTGNEGLPQRMSRPLASEAPSSRLPRICLVVPRFVCLFFSLKWESRHGASFIIPFLEIPRDLLALKSLPRMQAPKRQPRGLDVNLGAGAGRTPSSPLHPLSSLPVCVEPASGRSRVPSCMELVAGCYEQVLFGFAVHLEPKASGDREVRARAGRGRRGWGGRRRVWFPQRSKGVHRLIS